MSKLWIVYTQYGTEIGMSGPTRDAAIALFEKYFETTWEFAESIGYTCRFNQVGVQSAT